jgi:hypothetical protein
MIYTQTMISELTAFEKLERMIVKAYKQRDLDAVSLGLKNWIQRCEINRHRYFESKKVGYDIGPQTAAQKYIEQFAPSFARAYEKLEPAVKEDIFFLINRRNKELIGVRLPDYEYVHSIIGDYN